jgi:hypothetical protein
MPLALALAPLAVAAAFPAAEGARARLWRAVLPGAAAFALLLVAPPLVRELLGWSVALAVVVRSVRRPVPAPAMTVTAVLALAGGALGAFGERLLTPFHDTEALLSEARALGTAAAAAHPDLRDPLVRVSIGAELPELGANTAFAAGLSSLDGYFFPSRRLIALVAALRHQPYQPSAFVLRVKPGEPAARALFPLYNVRWRAEGRTPSTPSVPEGVPPLTRAPLAPFALSPLGPTAGRAWFSNAVDLVPSMESLAAALDAAGEALHEKARDVVWIVQSDLAARDLAAPGAACASATVSEVHATREGQFAIKVATPAPCPLTVATTFAESLEARVRIDTEWRPARTFPAYGALLGILVPQGATDVVIAGR